jgi:hypothetical protein
MNYLFLWSTKNHLCRGTKVHMRHTVRKGIIKIIIIIILQLGPHWPVSASSDSLFTNLPIRFGPFYLKFSIVFSILLFILITCRSQFDLCRLSFSSTGPTFKSPRLSSFFLLPKSLYTTVLKHFISIDANRFYPFLSVSKFRVHIQEWAAWGVVSAFGNLSHLIPNLTCP